jgi:hypothetical protein
MPPPPTADPQHALRTFNIVIAIAAIATVGIVLRFLSRRLIRASFGADDGLILLAWLFMLGLVIDYGYSAIELPMLVRCPC